ncbi:MAG TPA: hypothetical protein VL053_18645, partial [Arachidicoccus sp.]|nr:hypothetical protein [Arachidicoccus sp.]
MKRCLLVILSFLLAFATVQAQQKPVSMRSLIKEQFSFAQQQYKLLAKQTPMDKMPKSFEPKTGEYITSGIKWWCSGFFPGSLWYIYEYTKDPAI